MIGHSLRNFRRVLHTVLKDICKASQVVNVSLSSIGWEATSSSFQEAGFRHIGLSWN